MIADKHLKLLRRFIGNLLRPRYGFKNNVAKVAKSVYLLVLWILEILGDILFFWRDHVSLKISDPKKLLIVKADQLGDLIFSTMLLPLVKEKYPDVQIDYLTEPKSKSVLDKNPHVANVYGWHNLVLSLLPGRGNKLDLHKMSAEDKETLAILRRNKYDLVINARAYSPSSNIVWRKISKNLITFDISEQSFLADYWAKYDLEEEEWRNYSNLLIPLGIDSSKAYCKEEFYNLGRLPEGLSDKYVIISAASLNPERQWPIIKWKELIYGLRDKGYRAILTGTGDQESYIQEIVRDNPQASMLTKLSIPDLAAVTNSAAMFIGLDSFPAHLAIALKKQTYALVNTRIYYLKGYSKLGFAIDGRCMLPILSGASFFDVEKASPEDILKLIK